MGTDKVGGARRRPAMQPPRAERAAERVPAQTPTPTPRTPRQRSTRFEVPRGGTPAAQLGARPHASLDAGTAAARTVYERHGDQRLDVRTPAGAAQLISRSPQLGDGSPSADRRCGTAALFNGMLLAGNPRGAAAGIRQLAANVDAENRTRMEAQLRQDGVPAAGRRAMLEMQSSVLSPEAQRALTHLESGRITPREAATLQDALFSIGMQRPYSRSEHPTGLSRRELEPMARDLAARGAFGDASMTLHNRFEPDGVSEHWTVSVTPRGGTQQHADSWPSADGFGTVRPGGPSGRYQSHVTINPD